MTIQHRKTRWIPLLAGFLGLLMLFAVPVSAAGADLNYGTGSEEDITLSASELFELLYKDAESALTPAEREALDALSEVALTYNRSIPDTVVERTYDGERGVLTVLVHPLEYQAANGKTVTWVPTSVSLDGGEAVALVMDESGLYEASFPELWYSDEIHLDVDFSWQVEIPAETADGLLTLPYTVASEALSCLTAYRTAKAAYDKADKAHKDYLKALALHEKATADFEAYTEALSVYTPKKQAYDAYLLEKAAYDKAYAAYADYLKKKAAYDKAEKAYYEYEAFRQNYESIYDAYEPYLKGLEAALSRISILDSMFLTDSNEWQFYGGVMGSTVDSVLSNRYELITVGGVKRVYVDNADAATNALRPLLKGYNEVRSAKYSSSLARHRAKFAYYNEHYEAIRDQVTKLYQSIYSIYSYATVSSAMAAKYPEKVPHFRQFLAQLYVLHCALDDTVTPDPAWTVSPNAPYTVAQLVEEKLLFPADIVASPAGVTLPETEVVLPDESFPEPVEKPVKDYVVVDEPTAPAVVPNPGKAPTPVKDPGDPPAVVLPPEGDPPTAPALTDLEASLADELERGVLKKRAATGKAHTLTFTQSVSCTRYISNRKTVTFYNPDGSKHSQTTVEYGASVTAPVMLRPADDRYSYTFLGWVRHGDPDPNNHVNLQAVKEDLSLYPSYQREDRRYRITWVVDTIQRVEYYLWNEIPTCPISTNRYSASQALRFTGWSPAVTAVKGDAVYTAQYEVVENPCVVTWVVGNTRVEEVYEKGEMPTCPLDTNRATDTHIYTFLGWNRPIRETNQNVTYVAQYRSTPLGTHNDGSVCRVEFTDAGIRLYAEQAVVQFGVASELARERACNLILCWDGFTVTLTPSQLTKLNESYCVKLELTQSSGDYEDSKRFRLRCLNSIGETVCKGQSLSVLISFESAEGMYPMAYRKNGSKWKEVTLTRFATGGASLSVTNEAEMLFICEYRLQYSEPTENCNLSSLPLHAPIGSTVDLTANCTYGYEIVSATLQFADGSRQTITEKTFVMPKGAVSVELTVEPITYFVQFVLNGEVIFEETLFFGEAVHIPDVPTETEDADYRYTFAGWTPYITRATGEDRTPIYTATYSRTAKVTEQIEDTGTKSIFSSPFVVAAFCVAIVAAVAIPCICLRKRIARLFRRLTKKTATTDTPKKED